MRGHGRHLEAEAEARGPRYSAEGGIKMGLAWAEKGTVAARGWFHSP